MLSVGLASACSLSHAQFSFSFVLGEGTVARPSFGTVITPASGGVQRGRPHSLPISRSAGLTLDRAQGSSGGWAPVKRGAPQVQHGAQG